MNPRDGEIQKINAVRPQRPLLQAGGLKKSPSEADQASHLKKAAIAFEAYFIQSLLKEMRKAQPQGGLFEGGSGKEIYQSLFDEKIAQKMAENGGFGLSELIIKNLSPRLKNSGQSTDRKEAVDVYDRYLRVKPLGVENEDLRQ